MATFRLRRFNNPNTLKTIAPERLLSLLRPYREYFAGRGVDLPDHGDPEYEALVEVLVNPDEDVPSQMVDALYFIDETADEEVMDQLLEAAQQRGIDLGLDDGPTPADVAVAVWLAAPALLEEVHAESFVTRPRQFEYFQGATGRHSPFPAWTDEKRNLIQEELDDWFADHRRGDGAKVFMFPHGDRVFVLIRHGATMKREGSIDKGERGIAYYRPEVHDVLVFDTSTNSLGLHAQTKGEKSLYREVFGHVLFSDANYFAQPIKLTLDPLRDQGPAVLACEDVLGMELVKLVEVRRFIGGAGKLREVLQGTDLFLAFGDEWRRRLSFGRLTSATFEVTLRTGDKVRTRRVTPSLQNRTKYDRDDQDAEIIETWLRRRGFMPGGEGTDADALVPAAMEVA